MQRFQYWIYLKINIINFISSMQYAVCSMQDSGPIENPSVITGLKDVTLE